MLKQFPERQTNLYRGRALSYGEGRLGPVVATDMTGRSLDCEICTEGQQRRKGGDAHIHARREFGRDIEI